ncbi:hypothetical protein FPANT_2423 [Fusarium pseudoanthophilum]|uniref:Uncharacterized protein n=1 Tax=Fusarium pseudoanthophilum TaxID=48495 RepID=A0A8H5UW57_9HYPO|nr:hypothetical protein FPANT_2423 [Fusarium pseudoanthophilum]
MNSRNEETQNQHTGSSDEMDELQNGPPQSNVFSSAAPPRMPIVSSLRKKTPPLSAPPGNLSSSLTSIARSTTSRRALERRVESLKAEKDREVREKRKLETENAALVLEAQKLRAERAQMKREIQSLKNESQVMQTEKELQEAEVRYKDDAIERLKGVLRRHHLL